MLDAFLTRMPILPIDTGRYGSLEMRHIFDEENKLQKWLDVEAAVAEAEASVGDIPKEAADDIAKNANTKAVTLARTKEIEKETRHDLMSMVMALTEACKGEGKKYVHYGLTSMDIEDTTKLYSLRKHSTSSRNNWTRWRRFSPPWSESIEPCSWSRGPMEDTLASLHSD